MTTVSTLGALTALVVAIVLILRKVPPAYGMLAGALAGGLVGGADLVHTVSLMIEGAQGHHQRGDAHSGGGRAGRRAD